MNRNGVTIAIYESHEAAEQAVKALRSAGMDFRKVSIVGKDYVTQEQPVGYFNWGDRARFYGKFGAFWGTLAGILLGSFVMVVPVLGHIIILGPLAATVVSGVEGAAFGAVGGALVGALTSIGVPRNSAIRYETELAADKFLLVVQGSPEDLRLAESVLRPTEPQSMETHATEEQEEDALAPA